MQQGCRQECTDCAANLPLCSIALRGAIWDLDGLGGWLFKGRVLGTLRERLENDRED